MMDLLKTRKHYVMALAIMFVLVSLSGTTYSLFLNVDETNEFIYNTGVLELQVVEDEKINIANAFPTIDSEGMKGEPYSLTIRNTGNLPYLFDLKMLSSTSENVIDSKYIKFQVNEDKAKTLYSANNLIASGVLLYPNEEITFNVRVWLDISMPNSELGNTFMAQIVTSGESVYRTLDTSGANYPVLKDGMIPVYYDYETNTFRKADKSNMIESYEWYNYDKQKWANVVNINDSDRKIYDIVGKRDIKIDNIRTNNGNYVSDVNYLDIGLSNYNYNNISNIFRVKFNNLKDDRANIISNGVMSYYYDTVNKNFVFKINNNIVSSDLYELEEKKWYIIGYTYNKNTVKFYVDGKLISSSNINGSISSKTGFRLGTDNSFENVTSIEFGDIYIYNDILTDNEFKNHYSTEINVLYDNLLIGYNDFEPRTLREYYISADMGTVIDNDDVNSYYVWIPRFKYKLWNVTGDMNVDIYDAYNKGIDIYFEKETESTGIIKCENDICYSDNLLITKVTKNDNSKYYTHPAFTDNGQELSGIWISKYEVSTDDSNCNATNTSNCLSNSLKVESKYGNTSWRNNTLSNYYQNIKKLGTEYNVIKNLEWGAMSYLAHSKYGLCVDSVCKNTGVNTTYISGNEVSDNTTNNMYGIFDISGGASEFVMASYGELIGDNFDSAIVNKNDYDIYNSNLFKVGDATLETSISDGIWYNNYNNFVDDTNNLFIRGGIGTSTNTGMFYYNSTTNMASDYITTRVVIK